MSERIGSPPDFQREESIRRDFNANVLRNATDLSIETSFPLEHGVRMCKVYIQMMYPNYHTVIHDPLVIQHHYGKLQFVLGKLTIPMAIFNS